MKNENKEICCGSVQSGRSHGFALLGLLMAVAILALMYYGASTGFFVRSSSQSKGSKPRLSEKALIKQIRQVVESGGDIDASQNEYKQTLLHIAAKCGYVDAVNLCLANGANTEVYDDPAIMTPLHRALFHGHLQASKVLIECGADIEARGMLGKTALDSAISSKNNRKELVKLLLASGASVKTRDPHGLTPLFWSISEGDPNVVELLIENGASIMSRDALGDTPLHQAAYYGQQKIAELLIEYGVNINARNAEGLTPLDAALDIPFGDVSIYDKERVANILRSHGAKRGGELNETHRP